MNHAGRRILSSYRTRKLRHLRTHKSGILNCDGAGAITVGSGSLVVNGTLTLA